MALTELLRRPEFYDNLGLLAFLFIIIVAIWALKNKKPLPKWLSIVLLIAGILGLIIDSIIVYKKFLS